VERWIVTGLAVVAAVVVGVVVAGGDEGHGRSAAQRDPLLVHLTALQRIADANGGTRAAGTRGDRATAEYIAARLRADGYRVTTQAFRVPLYRESTPPRLVVDGRPVKQARAFQFSPSGRVGGRVRAVPDLGCRARDYRSLRRGEIALVRRGNCLFVVKVYLARRAGAAAVLVGNDRAGIVPGSLFRPQRGIPVLGVTRDEPLAGRHATVEVHATSATRETSNVIGEVGPRGAARMVMAGAHRDSVPAGPGLNDDGSGVTALLTIAQHVPAQRLPAGVALRLGFWGGEEVGLVGSRRYVNRLTAAARGRIAAYVNLDMVGSPGAEPAVYDTNDRIETMLRRHLAPAAPQERLQGNSDHASFERAGIPVGGLFTGLDKCYHQACDTIRNVDRAVLATSTRAAEGALLDLARER
jgi:peptidase M28-like protein/PA domain-containing protein